MSDTPKYLENSKWTRLGSLFPQARTSVLDLIEGTGSTQCAKLIENDLNIPIISGSRDLIQTRLRIYEAICRSVGGQVFQYFYLNKKQHLALNEALSSQLKGYPKLPINPSEENIIESCKTKTKDSAAALTEILAYSFSQKPEPHRTSKSHNSAKEGYLKDDTYRELQRIHKEMVKVGPHVDELTQFKLPEIKTTDYLNNFIPNFSEQYLQIKENRQGLGIKSQMDEIKTLILLVEKVSRHSYELRENLVAAADYTLRLYFSDKNLNLNEQSISDANFDAKKYRIYVEQTSPKIRKIMNDFEKNNPLFAVERMDCIKATIHDYSDILGIKPIKTLKKINQTIHEYRDKHAMYPDQLYKPRKR